MASSPTARVKRTTPVLLAVCGVLLVILLCPIFASVLHLRGSSGTSGTITAPSPATGARSSTPEPMWKPLTSLYASLWTHELDMDFGVKPKRDKEKEAKQAAKGKNFTAVVGMLKQNGFDLVMSSVKWNDTEPVDGELHLEALSHVVDVVCNVYKLRLSIVVDVGLPPWWLYERYPDAHTKDSLNRTYKYIAIGHSLAMQRSYVFMSAIAEHIKSIAPEGCLHSMQPNFNNEYEAKFTQEYDCFQDYSALFELQYKNFFSLINSSIKFWNSRWATTFKSWAEVKLPVYWQGNQKPDTSNLYHDYIRFRNMLGSRVLLNACGVFHRKGVDCLVHIPEIYTVADPIFQGSIFFNLAKSPYVRYLVMDTNFMTAWGTENNPVIGQFLVSIAKAYSVYSDKFVYFEAAFEKFRNAVGGGLDKALHAGVEGLGYTNWYNRVKDDILIPPTTADGGRTLTCNAPVTTAFLAPHELAMYIRGLNHTSENKDPVQDHILAVFAENAGGGCGSGVHVFGDVDHFMQHAANYKTIINVQSPVLYKSTHNKVQRVLEDARKRQVVIRNIEVPTYLQDDSFKTIPTIIDDAIWEDIPPELIATR